VDAIELLVGGRGDAAMVREGAERAELSCEFEVSKAMAAWLEERDLAGDPGQLVLRRSVDRAGRSRCFINGHAATLAQLKDAGEWLVDLHGQHAHQSLLRSAAQRELLDSHSGADELARETAQAFRDWKRLEEVAAAASRLRALSEHDANLNPVVEMLESAEAQASEAVRELRQYASRVDLDPEALREAEARIEALHAAARRQRVRPEELPARFAELEKRLHELELAADPQAIEREVAAARA